MTPEKPIKPDKILKELSEIWSSMSKKEGENGEAAAHGGGILRACAMTLISFVDDEEDSMALGETLAGLMKEHPSRSVVVRLKEGEDFLDARAFAQCWMPFGHRQQICCEQVEITSSMNRLADVAAIVDPLAVPDLPRVILLRSARIVRSGALRKILPLGDKIIVDSERAGAPGFGELGGLLDAGHIAGDLVWTRLTEIRALLAQLLDGRTPQRITIEYSGREAGPEGRYLEAWLSSSLPSTKVGLKGDGGAGSGRVSVISVDNDLKIALTEGGAEYEIAGLRQRAALSKGTDEELLNVELGIVVHDPVFERALNRITA
ncbi:MAG TPA: glucose-6-phosphate dehydrogenase assembly protein OpcA [Bryobacteraceae bacterium]|nr:glucose-6-phosphate dehydrogenase assembly protein OpcA [Bryobacteraceae bacterium]